MSLILTGCAFVESWNEYQIQYESAGGFVSIITIILVVFLYLLAILPTFGLMFLQRDYNCSKKNKLISLVFTVIACPILLILVKPITLTIGHGFLGWLMYNPPFHVIDLRWLSLHDLHFYPTLNLSIGGFNFGWILGLILAIIYFLVLIKINGQAKDFDKEYEDAMKNVEHKEHLEIVDTVTYSGVFNIKEKHDVRTTVVDDTKYPIHQSVIGTICFLASLIIMPYICFMNIILRQLISLFKK